MLARFRRLPLNRRRPPRPFAPAPESVPAAASSRPTRFESASVRRRSGGILAAIVAVLLLSTAGAAPARAEGNGFGIDVYFAAGYERQIDSRTCTSAGVAMMMNFIARRDLNLGQLYILRYEQPRDALANNVQRGSDPLGWARAATYFSSRTGRPTVYAWEAFGSARSALKRAARQIALSGKPVGLLVSHGTHAMVMTGFTASDDPAKSESFTLYSIWVSDPNGSARRSYDARATPLNTYTQTDATPWYDAQWYGRYIVIVPQG
jgi:hypothetical protein